MFLKLKNNNLSIFLILEISKNFPYSLLSMTQYVLKVTTVNVMW
jgi:hypothetical protein